MSEGKQYRCDFETTATGVTMRVRRPAIEVKGSNWDHAYEKLISAIIDRTGDGEPHVSFGGVFPTQAADRPFLIPDWTCIYARGECMLRWMTDQLFTGGACDLCGAPQGKRNQTPMERVNGSSGDYCNAWAAWDEFHREVRVQHAFSPVIVSERFLNLLNSSERDECEWRPIVPTKRSRSRYFECIPRRFLPKIGHRDWEAECVKCDQCGSIFRFLTSPTGNMGDFSKMRITDWYAKDDLQKAADRRIIAVGSPADFQLIWPLERAKQLAASNHAVGMSLGPFGVIPRKDVVRRPKAQLLSVWERECLARNAEFPFNRRTEEL